MYHQFLWYATLLDGHRLPFGQAACATGRYRSLQVKVLLLQITPFKWDSQDGVPPTKRGFLPVELDQSGS